MSVRSYLFMCTQVTIPLPSLLNLVLSPISTVANSVFNFKSFTIGIFDLQVDPGTTDI